MLWVLYSILSAFSLATANAFTKRISHKVDDYVMVFTRFLYATPFLLSLLFFIPIPKLGSSFWSVLLIVAILDVIAAILYIKAIRLSPLSLTMPLLSLTPLFLIITSFLILGEFPSFFGIIGIIFIVLGVYLLNIKDLRKGILTPFKSLFREKGCRYMIFIAFIYSITSNWGKILIQNSSPLFFSAIYFPLLVIPFLILFFIKSRKNVKQVVLNFKDFVWIGLFFALMIIFHSLAITLIIVPYFISIKRTSSIFSVLYGHFLFKEKNIRERLTGAVIMLLGASLIILF